jgi:hypothetical protein
MLRGTETPPFRPIQTVSSPRISLRSFRSDSQNVIACHPGSFHPSVPCLRQTHVRFGSPRIKRGIDPTNSSILLF